MPNWCGNTLTVTGPARVVRALLAQVEDPTEPTALSLARIVPTPVELYDVTESAATGGFALFTGAAGQRDEDDWHSWHVRNWGTKWDVQAQVNVADGEQPGTLEATFEFSSAWSPPQTATAALAAQYPGCELVLHYDEPGMDVAGTDVWQGGVCVSSVSGPSEVALEWEDDDAEDDDAADDEDADEDAENENGNDASDEDPAPVSAEEDEQ